MYAEGCRDYDRDGKERRTGLFAGKALKDGELRTTRNGKTYGSLSVCAAHHKDGTAGWISIKSFDPGMIDEIAGICKGDRILAAGIVDSNDFNGKTYTSMLVDFLDVKRAGEAAGTSRPSSPDTRASNEHADFEEVENEGNLPF